MSITRSSNRLLSGALLIVAVLLAGCEEPAEVAEIVRPARVMRIAEPGEINDRSLPGRAQAVEEVNLSFDVSGTILDRPVNVGDKVTKGQVLARLDARDYENDMRATIAARDRAKANYQRISIAAESGAVSKQDLDDALAQLEVREAEVRIKRKAVEDTVIQAPRDGAVSATYVEAYTAVQAKEPIVRLLDITSIEMIVQVPENLISAAPSVTELLVEFDAFPGKPVSARIKEIGNEASLTTRTYPVKLIMDQPEEFEIVPGMAGKAKAIVRDDSNSQATGHIVPMTAIFTSNEVDASGKSYVWIVDEAGNTVQRRDVTTGPLTEFGIVVLTGISSGDLVVISGVNFLRAGQEVRPTLPGDST